MNYTFTSGIVVDMWSNEYGIAPLFVISQIVYFFIVQISHIPLLLHIYILVQLVMKDLIQCMP